MKSAIIKSIIILSLLSHNVSGKEYDWLLIYYMPYDNNLSPLSQSIIKQFSKANISDHVCVTLQVDLAGSGGMTRYSFNSKVDSSYLSEEESASSKVFDEYLLWVSKTFRAKHYSIILLNHGGGLNEYGLDEYPRANKWLQIDSLAISIGKFNGRAGISKIDLLFQQVCARGTLENLYEFNGVAKYTLASQDLVPAPGYYYPKVFSGLENGNVNSGDKLADLIVSSERDDMYYSYTLVDNSKWNDWLTLLEKFSEKLSHSNSKINTTELKLISYAGDSYFDFTSLINATSSNTDISITSGLIKKITSGVLIKRLYVNNKSDRMMGFSGLSICSPFKFAHRSLTIYSIKAYADFLTSLRNLTKAKQ